MKISMYLYTTELGCELEINNSLCKTILHGAFYAENDVFGGVETGNLEMLYTVIYDQNGPTEQTLGIQRTPTLVFYDAARNIALHKLVTREITQDNVYDVAEYLYRLEVAVGGTGYVTPDGDELSVEDIIEMNGPGGWGFGFNPFPLFKCGDVLPKWLCTSINWLLIIAILVLILLAVKKLMK